MRRCGGTDWFKVQKNFILSGHAGREDSRQIVPGRINPILADAAGGRNTAGFLVIGVEKKLGDRDIGG